MGKKDVIKTVAVVATSIGIATVVKNAIDATTPINITPIGKVVVWIGGFVLTGILGDMAGSYVSKTIDDVAETKDVVFGSIGIVKLTK